MMSDLRSTLRVHMSRNAISQARVALEANVSQATVSRALSTPSRREGPARSKLFIYLQKSSPHPQKALDAIEQVWDGSPEHDGALARLIEASSDLGPKVGRE
jgi:hypothetical protein